MNIGTRIIGLVGEIGSGKDEALRYLHAKYSIPYLATGDIVRQIAKREGVEPTRENLEVISRRCFFDFGQGCFVKMATEEIIKKGWKIAGISGIRTPADVDIMKKMLGSNFVLIRVTVTDPKTRFERVRRRHTARDPSTYKEFVTQDRDEEKTFKISMTNRMADFTLNNNGSIEDLHREIDSLIAKENLLNS